MNQMFCFQCEQTAGCTACTRQAGVCGKSSRTSALQDQLTGSLIGLAAAADNRLPNAAADKAVIEGLFTTLTNVNFDDDSIRSQIKTVNNL